MKAVLSNMGFILQSAGIFMLFPILVSFAFAETESTIGLFITATSFLVMGFMLNALCERKDLGFKESSALVVFVFIFLSIIGAIPYFYINFTNSDMMQRFTDSVFESASGFTTTGYSVIKDLDLIPRSIVFYRALTQFIGGIGIVLVLLVFFYPEEKLKNFSKSMGLSSNNKIKKTFTLILLIYCMYNLFVVLIPFIFGNHDIINTISFAFAAISTGGFSPVNDITQLVVNTPLGYMLIFGMILGASNFMLVAGLVKGRVKEAIRSEISIFIILMIISVIIGIVTYKLSFFSSLFHIVSSMATCGFGYINLAQYPESFKYFLSLLMFIGGTALSTAGGIKIFRLLLIYKAVRKAVFESISESDRKITLFGKEYSNSEIIHALAVILTMASLVVISTFIFMAHGYALVDSVFESVSSLTCTGLTVGIVGVSLSMSLKWWITLLMIAGRVEVFSIFIILSKAKEPAPAVQQFAIPSPGDYRDAKPMEE